MGTYIAMQQSHSYMQAFRITLSLFCLALCLSCDNDRARVMADLKVLDGTWRLETMHYKDASGKPVTVAPAGSSKDPTMTLTFIEADRTGIVRIDQDFHTFTYLAGNSNPQCTLTFTQQGMLPVEGVGQPAEATGKIYTYEYDHIGGDRNTLQLYMARQYLKTRKEEITEVQYIFARIQR